MKLEEIYELVEELEPKFNRTDSTFKTAVMLLASIEVGTEIDKIVEFTGLCKSFVEPRARRLVANKIWQGDKIFCEWLDDEVGTVAFWLDVCVAEGLVSRRD